VEESDGKGAGELAALAGELGLLPLALTQAGAYIARTPGMSVTRYRGLLAGFPARMHAVAAAGDTRDVIARVWSLTGARIAELDPLAPRLLSVLACYGPDRLPADVLYRLPGADELQVAQALGVLASYSMITVSGDAVGVHRLVQAVTLAGLAEDERQEVRDAAAGLLAGALPADPAVLGSWFVYARLLPHARAVLPAGSTAMAQIIDFLDASGDYTTARTLQHDRYRALRDTLGPDHPGTLSAWASLANHTGQAGDAAKARDQYAALLPERERVCGPDHPDTLADRSNLARWTGQAGDAAAARDQFAALLPIIERVLSPGHPDTLDARAYLARWTGEAGDPAKARDQYAALLPDR
jgi:hypothetical protein